MRKGVLMTALALGCAACSSQESKDIEAVKAGVLDQLRDPASAQFSNIRWLENGTVCGEVNAKNAYGGYEGKQRFSGMIGGEKPYLYGTNYPPQKLDFCQQYDKAKAEVEAKRAQS